MTSWRRMTSRFRHGLGTAGPPRPLQADTPVTWVTKSKQRKLVTEPRMGGFLNERIETQTQTQTQTQTRTRTRTRPRPRTRTRTRTRPRPRTRTRTHTPRYSDTSDEQSDGDDADAIPTTERIKPIVATWPHASETILLAVLGVAEWQRRSRRCASDLGATAFSLVLLFILASLTAVGVDGVGDGGAGDLSSGVLLSPLHIRTSAREGSVGVAVLPPRQSDGTFDCSFRDAEAKELSSSRV